MSVRAVVAYAASLLLVSSVAANVARAQCPDWASGFARMPVFSAGAIGDMARFDLGSGPELYVCGTFTAPSLGTNRGLARWNGTTWSLVPGAPDGSYAAIEVLDLGSGPALYAAYQSYASPPSILFEVARLDANGWTVIGSGPGAQIRALAVYDDGTGRALYVGGKELRIGGLPISTTLARWNGTTWTSVVDAPEDLFALEVYDPGTGPRLYAGGQFTHAGGGSVPAANIASWNGSSWSALGSGTSAGVFALRVLDFGAGPRLAAGGSFTTAGGTSAPYSASWNGSAWTALPGLSALEYVGSYDVHAGVPVAAVYLGSVKRWNGSSWSTISGPAQPSGSGGGAVASVDLGSGPELYASAGSIGLGSDPTGLLARWTGSSWKSVPELAEGFDGDVLALAEVEVAGAQSLYAVGNFAAAGTTVTKSIARFDGAAWRAVGGAGVTSAFSGLSCLTGFDDGGGSDLYVGGNFTQIAGISASNVARWDGTNWTPVGTGLNAAVRAFAVYDDGTGPSLYAGGRFVVSMPNLGFHVARWTGTQWVAVGSGVDPNGTSHFPDSTDVLALLPWDDGGGVDLYVAGFFHSVNGGIISDSIARWNGSTWSSVSGIVGGNLLDALSVWNGTLYAGGIGGLWRMSGGSLVPLAATTPLSGSVRALATYSASGSSRLLVAGQFAQIGGTPATNIASFDGASWSAVDGGTDGRVDALAVTAGPGGEGTRVYAGGGFQSAGGIVSTRVGALVLCPPAETFCAGDGSASPCPCGNASAPGSGAGCLNAFGSGGRLVAGGTNLLTGDTLRLTASGLPNSGSALFFQGTSDQSGGAGSPFGDGLRCAAGSIVRLGTRTASLGVVRLPDSGQTLAVLGGIAVPATVRYQVWYRNSVPFCTPSGFNLTNGLRVAWGT